MYDKMKIYIQKSQENKDIKFSGTVEKLLVRLKINPETVIVTANGTLVTDKEMLKDSDDVEVLQVVSGG